MLDVVCCESCWPEKDKCYICAAVNRRPEAIYGRRCKACYHLQGGEEMSPSGFYCHEVDDKNPVRDDGYSVIAVVGVRAKVDVQAES